jgi:hypothetical protein
MIDLLAIGGLLTYVCFDCADIQRVHVASDKRQKQFQKLVMTSKNHCLKCGGSRCYIKDQYGRTVELI